jgi:hypothetical protein
MTTAQLVIVTEQLALVRQSAPEAGAAEACAGEAEWQRTTHTAAEFAALSEMTWPALPSLSLRVGYLLLLLLGPLGGHQFYLRNWPRALLYLATAGCLGIGVIIDLCTLPRQTQTANARRALGLR